MKNFPKNPTAQPELAGNHMFGNELEPRKDPAAVALGRKGGLKGGRARATKLSAERRTDIAKHAANVRWRKYDA